MLRQIDGARGYHTAALTEFEWMRVQSLIKDQYLDRIAELQPDLVDEARARHITAYHRLPIRFDHAQAWPKQARLLDARHIAMFEGMEFFQLIRRQHGADAAISHDELNWRLVRPNAPSDVGPIHADKWFWDAGHGTMPKGFGRFKIWIAIHTDPGLNGLTVKPGSHRRDWRHHFERRDGTCKPVFDEDPDTMAMELLPLRDGQMVMFHDSLLHGGVVNRAERCRVSLELTVLYPSRTAARAAAG